MRGGRGAGASAAAAVGTQLCGSCCLDVGDDAIGCDDCETWVHNSDMCSGLPSGVREAISKYSGDGIKFSCMQCRISNVTTKGKSAPANGDPDVAGTLKQLFHQIRGICGVVKELSKQIQSLTSLQTGQRSLDIAAAQDPEAPIQPLPPSLQMVPPSQPLKTIPEYRSAIREELRELKEREKRKESIIVKGLKANSATDFSTSFVQLAEKQFGVKVVLAEVQKISGHADIFRVKIAHDDTRREILDKAKSLRGTPHEHVYISRDLTYAQRAEMFNRRQARRAQNGYDALGAVGGAPPPSQATSVDTIADQATAAAVAAAPTSTPSVPVVPPSNPQRTSSTQGN